MEKGDKLTAGEANKIYSNLFGDVEDIQGDRRSDIRRHISTIKGKYQPKEGEASNRGDLFY